MKDKVTIIIKTFDRHIQFNNLLRSLAKFQPGFRIVISDDGKNYVTPDPVAAKEFDIVHQKHEYDIGCSEGRNRAIRACETPYFLTLDDDFLCRERTQFETLLAPVEAGVASICTGQVGHFGNKYGLWHNYEDAHGERGVVLQHLPRFGPPFKVDGNEYTTTEFGLQYFIANCDEFLGMGGWTSEIKTSHEHMPLFYRIYRAGLECCYSHDSWIDHPRFVRRGHYKQMRATRGHEFVDMGMDAMGAASFIKKRRKRTIKVINHSTRKFDWKTAREVDPLPL